MTDIKEEFKVLGTLLDINTEMSAEVQEKVAQGYFDAITKKELIKCANTCFQELNFLSAAAIFERGWSRFSAEGDYLFSFGYFLFECEFFELSDEMLKKSIDINPEGDPRCYFTLAELHKAENGLELYLKGLTLAEAKKGEIISNFERDSSSEKQAKISQKLFNMKRVVAQAYCAVAELLMMRPEFPSNSKNIEEALEKAAITDPTYYEYLVQKSVYHFNLEDEQSCRKTIAEFVAKIREIEELKDEDLLDYPAAMLLIIIRMMIEGQIYEDGAYLASVAVQNDERNPEALYMLAFCSVCIEDAETASEAITKLSEFDLSCDEELQNGLAELKLEFSDLVKKLESQPKEDISDDMEEDDQDWEDQ